MRRQTKLDDDTTHRSPCDRPHGPETESDTRAGEYR